MNSLKVAALPLDTVHADPAANIALMRRALDDVGTVDIAVLPEFFTTGFITDPGLVSSCAQAPDGPAMQAVRAEAEARSCAICGTFIARLPDGTLRNRAFFIAPGAAPVFYDKRHLFSISDEADVLTPGSQPMPIIDFRGWRIALAVCYDLRFPVWCRNTVGPDGSLLYDILIIPASWPDARAHAWRTLLTARAIENQAYVIGANRSGSDGFGRCDGLTAIFDFLGADIGSGQPSGAVTATFSLDLLAAARRRFPVWRDADTFTITGPALPSGPTPAPVPCVSTQGKKSP